MPSEKKYHHKEYNSRAYNNLPKIIEILNHDKLKQQLKIALIIYFNVINYF